jgi:hypothetical protein
VGVVLCLLLVVTDRKIYKDLCITLFMERQYQIITYEGDSLQYNVGLQVLDDPIVFDGMLEFRCSLPSGAVVVDPARDALEARKRAREMAPSKTEFDLLMNKRDKELRALGRLW